MSRFIATSAAGLLRCISLLIAVFVLLLAVQVNTQAQQKAESRYSDSGKLPWVVTRDLLKSDDPGKVVADFATYEEAAAAMNALNKALPFPSKLIYFASERKAADAPDKGGNLLDRVKDAKEAVDEARDVANGDKSLLVALRAKEQKLGDAIKDYTDVLKKSLKQAVAATKTLIAGVGNVSDAKFKLVNQLIDQYNDDRSALQSVMGAKYNTGFSPLPRVAPSDGADKPNDPDTADKPKDQPDVPSIAGQWKAARGDVYFNYNFKTDGTYYLQVKSIYFTQGKHGTWKQEGDKVTVRQDDSGAPGTGGFSKGREIEVKIVGPNKLQIDGDSADLVAHAG